MIVNGYILSYNLPVIIVRANNIFGTRQHPEKLIAGCCWSFLKNKKFTVHGKGLQKRTFLYVKDFCKALDILIKKGKKFNEKAYFNNKPIIEIDKKYIRPLEVNSLRGSATKARKVLKWKPTCDIHYLVRDMVKSELKNHK